MIRFSFLFLSRSGQPLAHHCEYGRLRAQPLCKSASLSPSPPQGPEGPTARHQLCCHLHRVLFVALLLWLSPLGPEAGGEYFHLGHVLWVPPPALSCSAPMGACTGVCDVMVLQEPPGQSAVWGLSYWSHLQLFKNLWEAYGEKGEAGRLQVGDIPDRSPQEILIWAVACTIGKGAPGHVLVPLCSGLVCLQRFLEPCARAGSFSSDPCVGQPFPAATISFSLQPSVWKTN